MKYQLVNKTHFEARHPRCVASTAKNFCVLHNEVEHNYISSSITLGLQLHVSALYVGHLQVVIDFRSSYTRCMGCSFRLSLV